MAKYVLFILVSQSNDMVKNSTMPLASLPSDQKNATAFTCTQATRTYNTHACRHAQERYDELIGYDEASTFLVRSSAASDEYGNPAR